MALLHSSLSSLAKPSENGNGVTFRSGADVNMDIGVSPFGPETIIDRSMAMVSAAPLGLFKGFHLRYLMDQTLLIIRNKAEFGETNANTLCPP